MKLPNIIKLTFAAVVFLMLAPAPSFSQTATPPYKDGEVLEYVLHYKWGINADIAQITATLRSTDLNGEECFHYYCSGNTFKFWDSFFKVRDLFEAKFTASDANPRFFHRDVNEGNYHATNVFSYDPNTKRVKIHVTKQTDYRLDSTLYLGGGQIYDILSMLARVRGFEVNNIMAGKPVILTMAMDRNLLDVSYRYMKRETIKIGKLGQFKAIKIALSVVPHKDHYSNDAPGSQFDAMNNANQVFKGKDDIFIWLSDDDNHIPLVFKSPVSVGTINGTLTRMTNQKYPVTSKISD